MRRTVVFAALFIVGLATWAPAQTPPEFKGHKALIYGVAFSPDGKILATASFDSTVKLWDFEKGKELATLKGHTAPVYSVVFSPDGNLIATSGQDNTIRIWDKDGKFEREIKGHTGIVDSLAFSPDSAILASGSADKSVRLWNPKDGKEIKNLGAHNDSVYTVAFSPNGKLLASGSNDTTVKIWDVKEQKLLKQVGTPPKDPAKDDPKKDKKKVDKDKKDEKKDEKKDDKDKKEEKDKKDDKDKKPDPKKILDLPTLAEGITGVMFTPDSNTVLAVSFDKHLHFIDAAEGKEMKRIGPAPDDLFGLAISRDGKFIATAGYGGSLHVYDVENGNEVFKHQLEASKTQKKMVTYCVVFSPDGRALITGHELNSAARVTPIEEPKKK